MIRSVALSTSMMLAACGGAQQQSTEVGAVHAAEAPTQAARYTPSPLLAQTNMPIVAQLSLASFRGGILAALANTALPRRLAEACHGSPLDVVDGVSLVMSVDDEPQAVWHVSSSSPHAIACIQMIIEDTSMCEASDASPDCADKKWRYEANASGVDLWTQATASAQTLRQAIATAPMPNGLFVEVDLESPRMAMMRAFAAMAMGDKPELAAFQPLVIGLKQLRLTYDMTQFALEGHFSSDTDLSGVPAMVDSLRATLVAVVDGMPQTDPSLAPAAASARPVVERLASRVEPSHAVVTLPVTWQQLSEVIIIAAPAFDLYTRRSKSVEALANLGQIKLHVEQWSTSHVNRRRPPAFPVAPRTHHANGAGEQGAIDWSHASWVAYGMNVEEFTSQQYYFDYEVAAQRNTVTVHAYGDLNNDGTFSHYSVVGTRAPNTGEITWGEIQTENENE